jgi:hypothetical protein
MSSSEPPSDSAAHNLPFRSVKSWFSRSSAKVIVGSVIIAVLLSLSMFAPRFWLWPGVGTRPADLLSVEPEIHRAFFALEQLRSPWAHIENNTNQVMEWRLFWPVVAHYFQLPTNAYLALPAIGCLFALAATASVAWRATRHIIPSAGATLMAATSSWFFVSNGWLAYFDSWLVLALLLASFAISRRTLVGVALIAPWIDERFIVALPLCLAVRILGVNQSDRAARALASDAVALLAGIAPYLMIRGLAEFFHVRATTANYWSQHSLLPASLTVLLIGAWEGLRLGWIALAAFLVVSFRTGRAWGPLLAIFASLALNLCIADDLSRSVSIAMPVVLMGTILAWRSWPSLAGRALPLLCVGNLLLPAAHIVAKPFHAGENYHRIRIGNIVAELDHARHPPDFADPAAYSKRGLEAYQAGNLPLALRSFDAALRFDPRAARARANRGLIRFLGGRQSEGMADLDQALLEQPDLFVARMQRAKIREQIGDAAGAIADIQEALKQAPSHWTDRAEAAQLERALAARLQRK